MASSVSRGKLPSSTTTLTSTPLAPLSQQTWHRGGGRGGDGARTANRTDESAAGAVADAPADARGGGGGGGGNSSNNVFLYYFAHTPSYSANYPDLPTLGAFHGAEVPFAFGAQFELKTDAERALSAVMRCYWRNFAHTGDPNAGPCISPPQPWPRFLPGPAEATMVLDLGEALKPEQRLKATQCQAFAKTKGWGGGGGGEAY